MLKKETSQPEPPCRRCQGPLKLCSKEMVSTSSGNVQMDVYECIACDLLEARQHSVQAAWPSPLLSMRSELGEPPRSYALPDTTLRS